MVQWVVPPAREGSTLSSPVPLRSCAARGPGAIAVALALIGAVASATFAARAQAPAEPPPSGPAAPPPAAPAASAEPRPRAPADTGDSLIALGRDLELVVNETGPDQPWTLHIHNRGTTPIGVMADPGLLWFEVAVPGAGTQTCRLPEPLWPKNMRRRAEIMLAPDERFSRRFDPRFFCFAELVQTALIPGAKVTPHFGWPHEMRSTVVNGKRVEQPLTPRAPFIAWAVPEAQPAATPSALSDEAEGEEPGSEARPSSEGVWQLPSEGLKNLVGGTIVLSPAYSKWSERSPAPRDGMAVGMLAGSDAEDERAALVTVGIGNAGASAQTAVVRRELLSFDVLGPDGSFECATGDMGSPDVASFSTLAPRAAEQLVVRLIEMCPRGSFSRPGLYEVRATWHAKFSGQALNIDAFVGDVSSPQPALVRVRSGERSSFLRALPMVATGAGNGARGDQAPTEVNLDGAPAEDAPADAPQAPDEAPAQEVPAPDTSVE
jgi:hypothetical protein